MDNFSKENLYTVVSEVFTFAVGSNMINTTCVTASVRVWTSTDFEQLTNLESQNIFTRDISNLMRAQLSCKTVFHFRCLVSESLQKYPYAPVYQSMMSFLHVLRGNLVAERFLFYRVLLLWSAQNGMQHPVVVPSSFLFLAFWQRKNKYCHTILLTQQQLGISPIYFIREIIFLYGRYPF